MMRLGALLLIGAAGVAATSTAQDTTVRVPRGAAPAIDGRLAAGEWDAAARSPLPGGGEVLLMRDGDYLYIGMRAARTGFPSVCVQAGDTVRVLHASAALGTAVYVRDGEAWRLRSPFRWGMRNPALTPEAAAERQAHLREHGWLASTVRMGGREKEMQVPLRFISPGSVRLGLAYFSEEAGGPPVTAWPAELADGCAAEQMVRGFDVQELRFDSGRWTRLELR